MPIGLNPIQRNPEKAEVIHDYLKKAEENKDKALAMAFTRANQRAAEARKTKKKKEAKKKYGSISLSNTDTVNKCVKIRAKLKAKLQEITGSNIDEKIKHALVRDVMMQLNKVEVKINEIKRREAAIQEEKKAKKDESAQAVRRRRDAIRKRTTAIQRKYLHSASEGGLDPANPLGIPSGSKIFATEEEREAALEKEAMMAAVMAGMGSEAALPPTGLDATAPVVTAEIGGGEIVMCDADVPAADVSIEVLA